jgi:hypothetical protein
VRVAQEEGSITCPMTTAKLINQDNGPCRIYSRLTREPRALLAWANQDACAEAARTPVNSSMLIVRSPWLARQGSPGIDLTALNDFLFPLLVGNFCQPISEAVRSEQLAVPFFEQIGGMPWRNLLGHRLSPSVRLRFLSLSDFLIGRLAFAGASHAIAAI